MKHLERFDSYNMNVSDLTFRHQSIRALDELRPLRYDELEGLRSDEYMLARRESEEILHSMIDGYDPDTSFLYATIVGYHLMEGPRQFDGYTYYFKMTEDEVENCVFEIVDRDLTYGPMKGMEGLRGSLSFWDEHRDEFEPYNDPVVGEIRPRIEVAISFPIKQKIYGT